MRSTFLFLVFISASPALAESRLTAPLGETAIPPGAALSPLLSVTTDRDDAVSDLSLMRDQAGTALGFAMETRGGRPADATPFLFADIGNKDGVTLLEDSGRKVVLLQGKVDEAKPENRLHLKYLSNGLFGTYNSCDVLLESSGGGWSLQNAYTGEKVTSAKVLTSAFGVDTLEGICPAQ
jgi:hypothetical protein